MTTTTATLDSFQGQVLRPGDDGYDDARRLWNGAVDRRPAFIAQATNTSDVVQAVRFAVDAGLPLAVRGGGHSIPGHSVCDGGLMLDLSRMREVHVDPEQRVADVQPGVLLAELDAATQAHGLATPGGEVSHTGVAGLTLGGGVGWLSRMFGLACDNLIEAEVVTASGDVVVAREGSDLLWGLRGGGGNFGVVTRFRFALHPVGPVLLGGIVAHPLDRGRAALQQFRELAAEAPDELSLVSGCITAPPAPFVPPDLVGQPLVTVGMLWVGDVADGEPWAQRLRSLEPAIDLLGAMPYVAVQSQFDEGVPHGLSYYLKSEWLSGLDDAAIDAMLAAAAAPPSPLTQILLRQLGGAFARVPASSAAFSYRDPAFILTVATGAAPDDAATAAANVTWARDVWESLRHLSSGGVYVNQIDGDEPAARVRSAYAPQNWDRLVALKQEYDPENVFRLNANIPPSG